MRALRLLWASPCSLVGLLAALLVLACGGRARRRQGAIEVSFRDSASALGARSRSLRFGAITLGHVIIGLTRDQLDALRAHEQVHVRQYERWGIFFFLAYPASSAWQWLRGRRAYLDNRFEIEARNRSAGSTARPGHSSRK